jgi:hypothetical protein
MEPTPRRLAFVFACIVAAADAFAQQLPVGNWQSVASETYSHALHPVLTQAEFYLAIDVSNDGSFRGKWGEYFCTGSVTFSCQSSGSSGRVSGKLAASGQGVIELERLGRSAFNWSSSAADALAIDLPKNWQGDQFLYRARLTRDGKRKPASISPPDADLPILSANALYREFKQDERGALARNAGKTVVLEGRRGTLIERSDGGAAIHIADGFTMRALVLSFENLSEVRGIGEGAQFRFSCTVRHFDHFYVYLDGCSIVR